MPFPIRCFTCNKVIGKVKYIEGFNTLNEIKDDNERGNRIVEFFESHGIVRMCCKRMFTTVDTNDQVLVYSNLIDNFSKLSVNNKKIT